MPTQRATTREKPRQLDRRIRYDRTTPTQTKKIRNVGRKFSGICGGGCLGGTREEAPCSTGGACRTVLEGDDCCPILLRPESAPPTTKHTAARTHTAGILRPDTRTFPTVIPASFFTGPRIQSQCKYQRQVGPEINVRFSPAAVKFNFEQRRHPLSGG